MFSVTFYYDSISHYSNTHFPHYSPDAVKIYNNDNQLLADYVNSLRYYDRNIDELFKVLKAQNKLDRTIIISTSDHSESVGEHIPERGHFGKYNDWKTRVPMWVYMPPALREKFPSGILLENTQHVVCNNDIVPTLLDIYNLPVSPQIKHGQSLLRTLKKNREIYIYNGPGENRSDSREYFAAVNDTSFYIATKNGDRVDNELFMRDDHYQKNDLFKSTGLNPTPYKRLLRELKIFQ